MSFRDLSISLKRVMSAAVTSSVVATIFFAPPASAVSYQPGTVQKERTVAGYTAKGGSGPAPDSEKQFRPSAPVWPSSSGVDVGLPSAGMRAAGGGAPAKAGDLPILIDPQPAAKALNKVRVEAFGRAATKAAGVEGLVLRVGRIDGTSEAAPGRIAIDYNGFRYAFGGDWATRLRLIELPECALTMPSAPQCRGRVIPSKNDPIAATVTALVDIDGATTAAPTKQMLMGNEPAATSGGTLMALSAAPEGGAGDYKATSLEPSATWGAGTSTGEFTWNYPLRMPPAVGGPSPNISLGYTSSSVDGKMATTNSQASWLGEGFNWHPGYVERSYNTCSEDMTGSNNNSTKTGDQCWDTDNATLSMSGHAGDLIKDGSNANRWHLRSEDGTFVEHKTGTSNGDNDGEWWVVRTTDGTQYWFGGRSGSNSTLVSTVYGNHPGEPCNTSDFASSHCNQAYRWQLDHVVDRHGNTMSFTYAKETNKYSKNGSSTDLVNYDRAGYLTKIEYGTRTGSAGLAPVVVDFNVADRCLSSCSTKDAAHWPDVPFDQECTTSPCYQGAPSFWTTKRLASIKTRVLNAAGTAYSDVESWTFTHTFPDPEDSITAALWLDKISHSGLAGMTTGMPDITFQGVHLTNRVDTNNDQFPAMNRFRIKGVTSETGGKIDVTYSAPDCVKGTRVPDQNNLQDNKLRCYPVKWTPSGYTNAINDFFQKYVVTDVTESDLTGSSTRTLTHYDYLGDPAWHYTDDDGIIKADKKTWSVWRGYGTVKTTKGDPGEQTSAETRYFRGMHGDHLPSGTRTVVMPAIATGNIPAIDDEEAYAGRVRETITYNGPGGAEVSATATVPWQSSATATRTINNITVYARYSGTKSSHTRTARDGGRAPRTASVVNEFDAYGAVIKSDNRGEDGVSGDEKCVLTDYVRNTSTAVWLLDRVSRERRYAVDCAKAAAGPLTNDDIVDEVRTTYDGLVWNATPSAGDATEVEVLKADGTMMVKSQTLFDVNGRIKQVTDIRGGITKTEYTPATGGPLTSKKEISPLGWVKTTTLEPAFGLPLSATDANGRNIGYAYDGLGRLTSVWLPGRDKGAQSASIVYEYLLRNNAATVIVAKRLAGTSASGYVTSYQLFDTLLRARQSQDQDGAGGTGAVITDTFHDSAGRPYKTHDQYLASAAPGTSLFVPTANIPAIKVRQYDGAGREIALVHKVDAPPASNGGTEKYRTVTGYGGDRTDTILPVGGTMTSTIVNADGKTTELRQYHTGGAPSAAADPSTFDKTTYEYDRKDLLRKITDAAGNTWSYEYDLLGRKITDVDPDKGTQTSAYNDYGDLVSSKDVENVTVAYTYDSIGRKETVRDGSVSGNKRLEWRYDTLSDGSKVYGQTVKSMRYAGSDIYAREIVGFTTDYQPTTVRHSIPGTETGLAGTYDYLYTYNPDKTPYTTRLPAMGDLAVEQLTAGYNALGKPTTLNTSIGSTTLVTGTDYTSFNEVGAVHLRNNGGYKVDTVRTYETDTRRVAQIWTTRQTAPTTVADVRFSYDAQGNVTKISDVTAGDTQCFKNDYLRRMNESWTPSNGDCSTAPTLASLGGPAKYWQQYTFDLTGNRKQLVENTTANGVRTTDYALTGHRLDSTSTKDDTGTKPGAYTYYSNGNLKTRPTPSAGTQTLTWDAEGHLATSSDSTGLTSYVYDADGNRLIRKDPAGKTLYLPGQELRYTISSGTKKCTRYYSHNSEIVAMRTVAGIVWLSNDHHGTAQISINNAGQAVSIRRENPFGAIRATTGTWPSAMDKGFVGGTKDNTGLTHLGAREYDPLLGRFISVDPVIDVHDPQQMNGYAYGNNAPASASDPNGLWPNWVKAAAQTVGDSVKSAGNFVVEHAGTISAVAGVAAIACSFIPPLQVLAPALYAVSAVTGAIDTAKSCSEGKAVDCGVGIAGMIPGGRLLTGAAKLAKASSAIKAAEKAADVHGGLRGGWDAARGGWKAERTRLGGVLGDARDAFASAKDDLMTTAKDALLQTVVPAMKPFDVDFFMMTSIGWETFKIANYPDWRNKSMDDYFLNGDCGNICGGSGGGSSGGGGNSGGGNSGGGNSGGGSGGGGSSSSGSSGSSSGGPNWNPSPQQLAKLS